MKTKSFVLVAVAVFAAIVGGVVYVAVSGGGDERRLGAAVRSFAAGNFAIEIAGTNAGFLKSVSGCGVNANVVSTQTGKFADGKQAGQLKYGPCQITFGSGMGAPLYSWITDSLAGKTAPKNVSIVVTDATGKATTRLDLANTYLTRFTVPSLDVASKDPLYFEATLTPGSIRKVAASASVAKIAPKAKVLSAAFFRFNGPGLTTDATKLNKIESWSFEVGPATATGVEVKAGPLAELGDLTVTVAEPAAEFEGWLGALMKGSPTEKDLTVELLDATLKEVLIEFSFNGTGLAAGELLGGGVTGAEAIARREFSMYVQGAAIKFNPGVVG